MREIQNTIGSDSDSCLNGEAGDPIKDSGWETESDSISSIEEKSKEFEWKLIKLANQKVDLMNIFKSLNISFNNIIYSPSGWTHNTNCPFKDHADRSPSFWYNSVDNFFKCHGCQKGGGAVQFLSFFNNKSQIEIAKDLLAKYGDLEDVVEEIDDELRKKVDNLILTSSEYFKNFMKTHSNEPKLLNFAENLLWSLDIYLERLNLAKNNIEIENLEARINIMKRKLAKFE